MMCAEKEKMRENDKGRLRKPALEKRDKIDAACREKAGQKIAEKLLAHPAFNEAKVIMCYRAFRSEVPTDEIVKELLSRGKTLCYPVCEKAGIMHAYQPLNDASWQTSRMGIPEPIKEKSRLIDPAELDIVICPMVAFDENKNRMGYGGGYYDRYLPQCIKALRIGIAFDVQRMEKLHTDSYDQPMDIIITEEKVY